MQVKGCASGKKIYSTWSHAQYDAERIADKLSGWHRCRHMEVFCCRECQSWHVGSMPNKRLLQKGRKRVDRYPALERWRDELQHVG